jgi:hypothetical protein
MRNENSKVLTELRKSRNGCRTMRITVDERLLI